MIAKSFLKERSENDMKLDYEDFICTSMLISIRITIKSKYSVLSFPYTEVTKMRNKDCVRKLHQFTVVRERLYNSVHKLHTDTIKIYNYRI